MNKIPTRKSLNVEYRKQKPRRVDVENFKIALINCLSSIKDAEEVSETEEFMKTPISEFLRTTFYKDNLVNTKGNIDLAIYSGKDVKSDVSVIIETKRPSNKAEFLTSKDINKKALQELVLYYLRERLDNGNNSIVSLIATTGYEWFIFKGEDFYKYFFKNPKLKKEYEAWKNKQKDSAKTESFYSDIAQKYINEIENDLPFVHLNFKKKDTKKINDYDDKELNTLFKVFSDVNLLGKSFGNDSNELNKTFYNELLHIIGLEEKKDKGKILITRKKESQRYYESILEDAIYTLESKDHLRSVTRFDDGPEKPFEAGLGLTLTWLNRIIFLKLLESQLKSFNPENKEDYAFMNTKFINGYDDLNDLFFDALAIRENERHPRYKAKYKNIPYLNSALFEKTKLEREAFDISSLNDGGLELYKKTILKDNSGKRLTGKLNTLEYLFSFLNCFDFSTEEGVVDDVESKKIINASILGLIFEKINGYKEGSFFTPAYITMYMSKETLRRAVVQKFKENEIETIETYRGLKNYCSKLHEPKDIERLNHVFNSLKICDPA
ncbi:type II restriction endonuclease, partial [Crocinitomicaceae bacterium]|nr:type II restriction endonuclease [Crocinitomicaceae bacterium]